MATTPLNFFTGPESNINSLAKKQGQVIFAVSGDETAGNIYQDISNTKRIKIGKNAETAQKDANGNVITDTYETKSDASAKLAEAKAYTDTEVAKKANSTHTHSISNIDNLQETLDGHDIAIDELNEEVSIDYSQIAFDTGSEYADSGIDFSVYQTKADGTLTTTAKTVSGAINELDAGIDNEASLRTAADTALDNKIAQISNPNLLINSDFRNPINQRGLTFYDNSQRNNAYTIDRWRINGLEVTVNEGSITIENILSNTRNFLQPFEFSLRNDVYTASCNVLAVSGQVRMFYGSYGNDLHVGVNTFTFPQAGMNMFIIVVDAGASVTLEWAKLEQGAIATPFVPRPIGEELALCQRYFRKYEFEMICPVVIGTYNSYVAILPGMRVSPTVTQYDDGLFVSCYKYGTGSQHTDYKINNVSKYWLDKAVDCVSLSLECNDINSVDNCGMLYGSCTVDAEIY